MIVEASKKASDEQNKLNPLTLTHLLTLSHPLILNHILRDVYRLVQGEVQLHH